MENNIKLFNQCKNRAVRWKFCINLWNMCVCVFEWDCVCKCASLCECVRMFDCVYWKNPSLRYAFHPSEQSCCFIVLPLLLCCLRLALAVCVTHLQGHCEQLNCCTNGANVSAAAELHPLRTPPAPPRHTLKHPRNVLEYTPNDAHVICNSLAAYRNPPPLTRFLRIHWSSASSCVSVVCRRRRHRRCRRSAEARVQVKPAKQNVNDP